jgi:hypothetical protein
MTNAKDELLAIIDPKDILAASIHLEGWDQEQRNIHADLRVNHTDAELDQFLQILDFEYDSGYGSQELDGIIWIKDSNNWFSRGEYDGSEWWELNAIPDIPPELMP